MCLHPAGYCLNNDPSHYSTVRSSFPESSTGLSLTRPSFCMLTAKLCPILLQLWRSSTYSDKMAGFLPVLFNWPVLGPAWALSPSRSVQHEMQMVSRQKPATSMTNSALRTNQAAPHPSELWCWLRTVSEQKAQKLLTSHIVN